MNPLNLTDSKNLLKNVGQNNLHKCFKKIENIFFECEGNLYSIN